MSTGDTALDLLAAIFRQALADARNGDKGAIEFLDTHLVIDWRKFDWRTVGSETHRMLPHPQRNTRNVQN